MAVVGSPPISAIRECVLRLTPADLSASGKTPMTGCRMGRREGLCCAGKCTALPEDPVVSPGQSEALQTAATSLLLSHRTYRSGPRYTYRPYEHGWFTSARSQYPSCINAYYTRLSPILSPSAHEAPLRPDALVRWAAVNIPAAPANGLLFWIAWLRVAAAAECVGLGSGCAFWEMSCGPAWYVTGLRCLPRLVWEELCNCRHYKHAMDCFTGAVVYEVLASRWLLLLVAANRILPTEITSHL